MHRIILEYSSSITSAIIITLLIVIMGNNTEIDKVKQEYLVKEVVKYKKLAHVRYGYASDLETICEKFYSSNKEKEEYHIRKAQNKFVKGLND